MTRVDLHFLAYWLRVRRRGEVCVCVCVCVCCINQMLSLWETDRDWVKAGFDQGRMGEGEDEIGFSTERGF